MNTPSPAEQAIKPLAPPSTSIQLLGAARDIQEQRARDYDQPGGERSMQATVEAFNIITRRSSKGTGLTESEGWLLMQILKDVRDRSTDTPHRDSLEDGISYSSLKAESRLKESISNPRPAVETLHGRSAMAHFAAHLNNYIGVDKVKAILMKIAQVEQLSEVSNEQVPSVTEALRREFNRITVK